MEHQHFFTDYRLATAGLVDIVIRTRQPVDSCDSNGQTLIDLTVNRDKKNG